MLKILKEIDEVAKERTYFHELNRIKDKKSSKVVGKIMERKGIVILKTSSLEESERRVYDKLLTTLRFHKNSVTFTAVENDFITKKSLKDKNFQNLMLYIKGEEPYMEVTKEEKLEWEDFFKKELESDGKVEEVKGRSLIELDDGIDRIKGLIDDTLGVKEGELYQLELEKAEEIKREDLLVLCSDKDNLYDVKVIGDKLG